MKYILRRWSDSRFLVKKDKYGEPLSHAARDTLRPSKDSTTDNPSEATVFEHPGEQLVTKDTQSMWEIVPVRVTVAIIEYDSAGST